MQREEGGRRKEERMRANVLKLADGRKSWLARQWNMTVIDPTAEGRRGGRWKEGVRNVSKYDAYAFRKDSCIKLSSLWALQLFPRPQLLSPHPYLRPFPMQKVVTSRYSPRTCPNFSYADTYGWIRPIRFSSQKDPV